MNADGRVARGARVRQKAGRDRQHRVTLYVEHVLATNDEGSSQLIRVENAIPRDGGLKARCEQRSKLNSPRSQTD